MRKGRLQPGKLFLVDVEAGRIVPDEEVKRTVASRRPYAEWYRNEVVRLEDLPARENLACPAAAAAHAPARIRLHAGRHEGDPRPARAERGGGDRVDGQRPAAGRALRPAAGALLVLQAAVRPGHEPADRLDPRGGRDERRGQRRLGAEPARRDAGARAPARDRESDPARRGARAAPPDRLGRLPRAHDRHDVAGRGRAGGARARRRAHLRRGGRGAGRAARTSSSSPIAASGRSARRFRRCSRSQRSTTIWCAPGRGCRPG